MKWIHRATLRVFAKQEENIGTLRESLRALVPFDLEEAKIEVKQQSATGFNDRKIKILTITLTKTAHTNDFLQFLLDTLTEGQKGILMAQAESRLDKELDYFIRIDKETWTKDRKIELTDSGNCYHIKLSLAAFPKKKETALQLLEKLLRQKNI
jgi:RNA binding exosome subunit